MRLFCLEMLYARVVSDMAVQIQVREGDKQKMEKMVCIYHFFVFSFYPLILKNLTTIAITVQAVIV